MSGAVARIGRLCICRPELDRINATIAEMESSPEWQARLADQRRGEAIRMEHDAHLARMNRVMDTE